jgi:hypothetical protein
MDANEMTIIIEQLIMAQTLCFKAHTDQIVTLIQTFKHNDEAIKKLIDERRMVYNEFAKRIEAAKIM